MAKGPRQAAASNPLVAAANYVRRRSRAILKSGGGLVGSFRAQRESLLEWVSTSGQFLPVNFCDGLDWVGEGAEHLVFFDRERSLAIKATKPNRYGHSVEYEGAQGSPLEYLRRLGWQNVLFGDRIELVGVIKGDDFTQVVTSQPWITAHATNPRATEEQVDKYFWEIGFYRSSMFPGGGFYFSPTFGLVAADAHSRNVLIDESNEIVPIDVVVGKPGGGLAIKLYKEFPAKTMFDASGEPSTG